MKLILCFIIITALVVVDGQKYELPLEKVPNKDEDYPAPVPLDFDSSLNDSSNGNQAESRTSSRESSSFLNTILSPLRTTYERAISLFSHANGSSPTMDSIRMQAFKAYLSIYNKTYPPEELQHRAELFFERRKLIDESIKLYQQGKALFSLRENSFVDWEENELKSLTGLSKPDKKELLLVNSEAPSDENKYLVYRSDDNSNNNLLENELFVGAKIPASKDWRDTGCVSTPINQMKCGACYAIATMSVIETMRCLNSNSSPTLSPQQIVDCSTPRTGYQNFGCQGGWPTRVLKYLQEYGVATRESCYPFVRKQNACRLDEMESKRGCTLNASPTDRNRIQYKVLNNERDILYHVANTGPVVTVMKATSRFLYYGRGIFDDPTCSRRSDDVDHAIVIVGYGQENGVDYWLIKNSWGTTTWGQGGYGKYKRGTNVCSIGHWGWVVTG